MGGFKLQLPYRVVMQGNCIWEEQKARMSSKPGSISEHFGG
jgi:hypothetical protein